MNNSIRYFPWAPKIPWKVTRGNISPFIPQIIWNRVIDSNNPILICNGGLLESYYSLTYLERIFFHFKAKKALWSGNSSFHSLIEMNSLSNVISEPISNDIPNRFPTPIFMDTSRNVYLNCMHNYINSKSLVGKEQKNYKPIVSQILDNSSQTWEDYFIPQIRNWKDTPKKIEQWAKVNRLDLNRPFVVIFPDTGFSIHKQKCLKWNEMEIKSLAAMLQQAGIQTIVFTNQISKTYTNPAVFCKLNLEWMLYLTSISSAILSEEIDWLLIALTLNRKGKIIGTKLKSPWSLASNGKFFDRKIYEEKKLTPLKVFQILTGKYE